MNKNSHENLHLNHSQNPYWGFWATLGLGIAIFMIFSILQGIVFGIYALYLNNWQTDSQFESQINSLVLNGDALALAEIPSALIGMGLIALFIKLKGMLNITQYLELYFPPLKTLLKWVGIMIVMIVLLELLNHFLERETPEFMTKVYSSTTNMPLLWFAIVIAAPFFEEYLFRGFLLEGLRNSFVGTAGAIFITSATWAAIHLQYEWFEIFTIFLMGILFAIAKIQTKSLYIPIAMHFLMNLSASVLMAYLSENPVPAVTQ